MLVLALVASDATLAPTSVARRVAVPQSNRPPGAASGAEQQLALLASKHPKDAATGRK